MVKGSSQSVETKRAQSVEKPVNIVSNRQKSAKSTQRTPGRISNKSAKILCPLSNTKVRSVSNERRSSKKCPMNEQSVNQTPKLKILFLQKKYFMEKIRQQ